MPRCQADRYGAASGALGSGDSWGQSIRFSEVEHGAGVAGMKRTRHRARRARLSLVGVSRRVDVGIHLEHGKALDGVFPITRSLCSQVEPLEDKRGRTAAGRRRGSEIAFGLGRAHLRTDKEHDLVCQALGGMLRGAFMMFGS